MFFECDWLGHNHIEDTLYYGLVVDCVWFHQASEKRLFELILEYGNFRHCRLNSDFVKTFHLVLSRIRVAARMQQSRQQHTLHHLPASWKHISVIQQTLIHFALCADCDQQACSLQQQIVVLRRQKLEKLSLEIVIN